MRGFVWLLLLAFLASSVRAFNLSIEDEASFYAGPGEKAAHVPLIAKNHEYFLILVNAKPVALLERVDASHYETVEPESVAEDVLRQYIGAGFPSVVLVQEEGSYASGVRSEQLKRLPDALRRERLFVRELGYRELQARKAAFLKNVHVLRAFSFDVLEEDLGFLDRTLQDMRQARSLDASEKFSVLFDQRYASAELKVQQAENVSEAYLSAAAAIANATQAVRFAQIRFGNESGFVRSIRKRLMFLEFDMSRAEMDLSSGKPVALSDFASIAVNARSLQRESVYGPPEMFWWYLFGGLGMLMALFAAWFWWRYHPRTPREAINAGQRILQKFRAFEEKEEKGRQ